MVSSYRIACGVEYNGANFHGWQVQKGQIRTVAAEVTQALSQVADGEVSLVVAGRTDAGVHATGQVIHVDVPVQRQPHEWVLGSNHFLPNDVALLWAVEVDLDFHARFKAVTRRYRYVIANQSVKPVLQHKRVGWVIPPLDAGRMQQAANCLIGRHDFTTFRAAGCQANSPVRTLHSCVVFREGSRVIIDVVGHAFLFHMVRNIVGSLVDVGTGKCSVDWFQSVFAALNRCLAGKTMAPDGLYLTQVCYPADCGLPLVATSRKNNVVLEKNSSQEGFVHELV